MFLLITIQFFEIYATDVTELDPHIFVGEGNSKCFEQTM